MGRSIALSTEHKRDWWWRDEGRWTKGAENLMHLGEAQRVGAVAQWARNLSLLHFFAYLAEVATTYSVCLIVHYGYADDYAELTFIDFHAQAAVWRKQALEGRPLQGPWNTFTFEQANAIGNLGMLRLLSIAGLALFAWLLMVMLRQAGASRSVSWLLPALVILLPAYQLTAAWAELAYVPYTLICACMAAFVLNQAMSRAMDPVAS